MKYHKAKLVHTSYFFAQLISNYRFEQDVRSKFGGFGTDGIWKRALTGKNDDCPEEDTLLPINEEDEDKIINNLIENPCAKNVVDVANSMDNEISNQMKDAFGSDDSNFNVVYQNGSLSQDNQNETTLVNTGAQVGENNRINEITITLNDDFLEMGTDVAIFNTIIHENIHALMLYQLDKMEIAPDDPNVDFSILADLWSEAIALKDAQGNVGTNTLEAQMHEIMSDVISTQAAIVLDYALTNGYNMNITQAEALAWSGLQSSVAWTVMDEFVKETFDNIISYETSGFEILAVGTKCN